VGEFKLAAVGEDFEAFEKQSYPISYSINQEEKKERQ